MSKAWGPAPGGTPFHFMGRHPPGAGPITTQVPLAVWQFLPKVLSFSHFLQSPTGQAPMQPQKFQMVTGFKWTVHLIRVAHRSKNIVIFRFVSKLNKSLGKTVITASHTHTKVPTRFVCHVLSTYPLHHVPLVAWSSPVWCYQIAGQYTPVWRQQFKGQSYNWAKHISVELIVGGLITLCLY